MRGVLGRTLGVPLFQEQVIKLAMVAAGFSSGEADQLRRSMAAWKRSGGLQRFEQKLVALRLGLRKVKGLSKSGAERFVEARTTGAFMDVQDLMRRAELNRRDLKALAAADALVSLAGQRHQAYWAVLGIETPTPLFAAPTVQEALPLLRPPTEGEAIVADYGSLGLTLRRHPLALLRPRLERMAFVTAERVLGLAHGETVRAAGLVITRQRPGTATGVVFATLEDETGYLNLIFWSRLVESQRKELLGSRLLGVIGEVQREGAVVHVLAHRLEDHTPLLGRLSTRPREFH